MKFNWLTIVFFLAFLPVALQGQDTLVANQNLVRVRLADSARAVSFLNVARNFVVSGTNDSALFYLGRSLKTASDNDFVAIQAECHDLAGTVMEDKGDNEVMLMNYLKASILYNRAGMSDKEAVVIRKIAARYFDLGAYKTAAAYFEQEYSLLVSLSLEARASAAEQTALSYYYLPSDSLSLKWFETALSHFSASQDNEGIRRCLSKMAGINIRTGKNDLALENYNKLLEKWEEENNLLQVATTLNNIGFLRFRLKDYENALSSFTGAAGYGLKSGADPWLMTDVSTNLGITSQILGKQNEMMQYFTDALVYAGRAGRADQAARIDHILAVVYFNKGDNYHAEVYCRECIEKAQSSGAFSIMYECYRTLSDVMEKGNDYPRALEYYERYLTIRDSLNFESRINEKTNSDRVALLENRDQQMRLTIKDQEISGLAMKSLMAETQKRENELKLLLKQQELDRSERDFLSQSLALEKERFELSRREQEVKSLKDQKDRDSVTLLLQTNLTNAYIERNKALQNEKMQQDENLRKEKKIRTLFVWIGALMVLVAAAILAGLVSTRRKNQKLADSKAQIEKINADLETKNREVLRQNEKISQQKDIIEQKNQAITDSIQYASRIQHAVLPPADFLTEWGIENFVFYRPKDIVSGDFYWGKLKGERIIVAAADCTGHGVPGAFMSMLGHAFLDEIVNTTPVDDAATILNMLRDEIITTLRQRGMVGEARDGMDIALCIIDLKNNRLDFAGANNPLYLVRDNKLTKIQADRMPIGIHVTTISPFTNNPIEIKKGDLIYIFSDGYADQFGGPKGKKFMYKPFQDLLLKNHYKPMDIQRLILENTFIKWTGDRDQVDDVLVIGMKI